MPTLALKIRGYTVGILSSPQGRIEGRQLRNP
jgi:hypothetical protein